MSVDSESELYVRYKQFARWLLLGGSRLAITAGVLALFFAVTLTLTSTGVLSVGPRSPIQSVLGSGVVAGLFSLISLTLTINQLISSRVFGALNTFQDKLEGGNDLRDTVSDISEQPSLPTNMAAFIAFTGETLEDEVAGLRDEHDHGDDDLDERIDEYADELEAYAEQVQQVSGEMPAEQVIAALAGPDFAHHLNETDDLRTRQYEFLTSGERERLDAIADLLGAITVSRQYFKTISLHQELAQLSRQFIFVGLPALAVAMLVPLVYKTNPAEVTVSLPLAPLMSAVLTVVIAPLVLLMAYMLRISTIFRYTVSVAPFVPPAEWPWTEQSD